MNNNTSNQKLVVVNACYGGFGLSDLALQWLEDRGYPEEQCNWDSREMRCHPMLVECVKTLGSAANGSDACLEIWEFSDDFDYRISEYDGVERVVLLARKDVITELSQSGDVETLLEYLSLTGCLSESWM